MNMLHKAASFCIVVGSIAFAPIVTGLEITVTYTDETDPAEGFWHPVFGAQRRAAFEHALSIWEAHLVGTIPLRIKAEFNDDLSANALGSSSVTAAWANLAGFPEFGWGFVSPLASQLNNSDLDAQAGAEHASFHMYAQFNSNLDALPSGSGKWYYGTDGLVPDGDNNFVTAALHEIGHGLGMTHLIDPFTGAYGSVSGIPLYHLFFTVRRGSTNLFFDEMTDAERLAASSSGEVYFAGPTIIAANIPNPFHIPDPNNPPVNALGEAKLYAPSPLDASAFVWHWDDGHAPDGRPLLMQPLLSDPILNIDYTKELLMNLGWTFQPAPEIGVAPGSLRFDSTDIDAGPSSALSVTITNTGSVDLAIIGIALVDSAGSTDADQFQITSDTTPGTLPPSQTRDVTVVFDPDSNDLKQARLRIYSDDTHQWRERIRVTGFAFDGTATTAWVDFNFVGEETGSGRCCLCYG